MRPIPVPNRVRRWLSVTTLVSLSVLTAAQDAPPVIGSATAGLPSSHNHDVSQELDTSPSLVFEEVGAADVVGTTARIRPTTLGAFNVTRFGFDRLDVYIDRTLPPAAERSALQSNGSLRLVMATRRENVTRYWVLREREPSPDTRVILDPLLVTDTSHGREQVQFATGNRGVPIIDVQYAASISGANSVTRYGRHLLVDLRSGAPRVLGLLQNVERDGGGGACGAFDWSHGTSTEISCRWNESEAAFRCLETMHRLDTAWGERRATRPLTLASPTSSVAASPLEGLQRLALLALQTRDARAQVDPLGQVAALHVSRSADTTLVVMASPLVTAQLEEPFGVRLHVAIARAGQTTAVREITPGASLSELVRAEPFETPGPPTPAPGFVPDGLLPSYRVRVLASDSRVEILQLTVTEGTARGVYLIGLERSGQAVTADAFLVATDAVRYAGCNEWATEPGAVAMQVTQEPFAALLDVEPSNRVDSRAPDARVFPREPSGPCRTNVSVQWQPGEGFRAASVANPCRSAETPRRVIVSSDGALSSAVAAVGAREQ